MSLRDSRPLPLPLLPEMFRATVARHPGQIAIDIPPGRNRPARQTLTYAELDALADAIAARLGPLLNGAEAIVGLLVPRTSPLLFAAQLGVLRAGGAYTCLDPGFPDERMREIIGDAAPAAILADAAGLARLAALDLPDGLVHDIAALAAPASGAAAAFPNPAADRLAYVIYTSGTTGKPKGVMIEHGQIANLVHSDIAEFGLTPADRVVQGSSAAYDSSIEETWLAFAAGACLLVMDDATARLGPDLVGWLRDEGATVLCPPPTLLRATGCTDPEQALPALRLLYVGGEALPRDIADLWGSGRRLVNGYGPTECAVTCVRGDIVPGGPITIGRAVPGMRAHVLDAALGELPAGVQGELCMAGAGLARGYRNAPELTAEKFVDHPRLGRLYRTGDLAECTADGTILYHGRIDAQVKLRGYRIELGEIEARLAALPGVRAAACALQGEGGAAELAAFIVPEDPAQVPAVEDLRSALAATLPPYMVPHRIGVLAELPTSVSGKLDRRALPLLEGGADGARPRDVIAPETAMEALLATGYAAILRREAVSVTDDFFVDLGGDSLSAAMLVTLLRDDPATAWVTVSDLYEARTPRALALLAPPDSEGASATPVAQLLREGTARPLLAMLVQPLWLAAEVAVAGWAAWVAAFRLLPLLWGSMGLLPFLLLAPLLALVATAAYVPLSILVAVMVKRALIGRYRAIRTPVWSGYFLRHWIVQQTARLVPWPLLQGTQLQQVALRALGARIGRRVHIHRDVELARGGWDLITIGDDVSLGQGAQIGVTELDRGDLVIGPVTLEAGATLQVRAGLSHHCRIGAGAELTALSVLNPGQAVPAGELWDGVPARCIGPAPLPETAPARGRRLSPLAWDALAFAGEAAIGAIVALPAQALGFVACALVGLGYDEVWRWFYHPDVTSRAGLVMIGWTVLGLPLTLVWTAVVMRLMGRVEPGPVDRWSVAFLRVWLKSGLLSVSGEWLTGTMFWRGWLRLAGMKLGRDCEISTILDVVPELIAIGEGTFFADGIYLGGAWVRQGRATLAPVTLGRNTFLGNHAVIPPGVTLPPDILIGIATVADPATIAQGQSRFGHPSFDLPRREVVEVDRSLTHNPGPLRYWNRVFWEALRFALPVLPLLLSAQWYAWLAAADETRDPLGFALVTVPLATLAPLVMLCGAVLVLKWALIGRVRPGQHALWSCWCSRWDFVYVAWARYATAILRRLDGTFLLPVYLRAMGLKIGRRAVLGPLFAQVVDPDMIEVGDGATVSAMFQAHTFEDRVLKVDKVRIGAGATLAHGVVPLYGAVIGERAHVGAHSVVMKQERLLPEVAYQGVPSRVVGREG